MPATRRSQTEQDVDESDKSKRQKTEHENEEKDDYTKRPPYVRSKDDDRTAKYNGSCHCGDVKFQIYKDPEDTQMCHCDVCQKLHGAPAHWSSTFHKGDVFFENGGKSLSFYRTTDKSTEYSLPVKITCSHCHSAICDEGNNMMLMYPSLIDFEKHEDREPFTPKRHVFYKFRAMDVHDGQEKYEGIQFDSPLMDEVKGSGTKGITGKGSRKNRDPNEKDSKNRSD